MLANKKSTSNLFLISIGALGLFFMVFSSCKDSMLGDFSSGKEVTDTLFLGIHFGMKKQDFYDHCWALNKKGVIRQGTYNTSVLYIDSVAFKQQVEMNFYPEFTDDIISAMPIRYNYTTWAPWNRALQSDSLIQEVVRVTKNQFGGEFTTTINKDGKPVYEQVMGTRKITIFMEDEQFVSVYIQNKKYFKS